MGIFDRYRAAGRAASRKRDEDIRGEDRAREKIYEDIDEEGELSEERRRERDQTRDGALEDIESYDPTEYANRVAGAQYDNLREDNLGRLANRRAGLNRRGLFGSNIGGARQERDFNSRLARALAGNAFKAAQLEGQNIDRSIHMSDQDRREAYNTRGRETEMTSGAADREQGAENMRRELEERRRARKAMRDSRKRSGIGGVIGGALGGLAGSVIPGVGTAAGASIGSGIGSRF